MKTRRPRPFRSVIVPLDGVSLAEAALAPALAVAGLFDAELLLAQVVLPPSAGSSLPVAFAAGYDNEILAYQRKGAQDYL